MKFLIKTDDIDTLRSQKAKYHRVVYTVGGGVGCLAPFICEFTGVTNDGSAYDVYLNGSDDTTSIASGETYEFTEAPTSTYYMFSWRSNLTSLDVSNFDTSKVTNMGNMFGDCSGLTSLDVSNFDTSKVTNMNSMFNGCSKLTSLDLSNFDTSNVNTMSYMFDGCSELTSLGVSNFDTSQVTYMNQMFNNCSKLTSLDVSNFDTSKVTNMNSMFEGCSGLTTLDVSNFDTSKVTTMYSMFNGCSGLTSLDVSSFDTSKVTNMSVMFNNCLSLRYITLGPNFFKTAKPIPFNAASQLGFNEDNSDNGWLEHLATVAPQQTKTHTIQLHSNLKNASWASTHLATLQSKGYTIS